MISVACPNCGTTYQIPQNALGDNGRTMRCAACSQKWFCTSEHIEKSELINAEATLIISDDADQNQIPSKNSIEEDPWNSSTSTEPEPDSDQALAVAKAAVSSLNLHQNNSIQSIAKTAFFTQLQKIDRYTNSLSDVEADAEPLLAAERKKRQLDTVKYYIQPQFLAIIASLIIVIIVLTLPSAFVRLNPAYASLYSLIGIHVNLDGLEFENIVANTENEKGTLFVTIEGDITNITNEAKSVPRVKFIAKNAKGADLTSWVMSSPRATLLSGEKVSFKSRYATPSQETTSIQVRFFNSKDLSAKPQ